MELNKLRYYLAGTIFVAIALICVLSICQHPGLDAGNRRVLLFDGIFLVVMLPLAVFMFRKGRGSRG
jgi:hypothetical protein